MKHATNIWKPVLLPGEFQGGLPTGSKKSWTELSDLHLEISTSEIITKKNQQKLI